MKNDLDTEKDIYHVLLTTLRSLGNVDQLRSSALISSCLVAVRSKEKPGLSSSEALIEVLSELLQQLQVGPSALLGEILRLRFWDGWTIERLVELEKPKPMAYRTVQENQRKAIRLLASWFLEKEGACQATQEQRPLPTEGREMRIVRIDAMLTQDEILSEFKAFESLEVLLDNFDGYEMGEMPGNWKQYGGATSITPTVERFDEGGSVYNVLSFPELRRQSVSKDVVHNGLMIKSPYMVTVKLRFKSEPSDRAGFVIAWNNRGNLIRVQTNLYWNHIEFWEYFSSELQGRVKSTIETVIERDTDYWLRVVANEPEPDQKVVSAYWSTDGTAFVPVLRVTGVAHLTGRVGLSTSGPSLPYVHFTDFEVRYKETSSSGTK